jgi:hypothetical protein
MAVRNTSTSGRRSRWRGYRCRCSAALGLSPVAGTVTPFTASRQFAYRVIAHPVPLLLGLLAYHPGAKIHGGTPASRLAVVLAVGFFDVEDPAVGAF